jgi:hypothetical protein
LKHFALLLCLKLYGLLIFLAGNIGCLALAAHFCSCFFWVHTSHSKQSALSVPDGLVIINVSLVFRVKSAVFCRKRLLGDSHVICQLSGLGSGHRCCAIAISRDFPGAYQMCQAHVLSAFVSL